MQPVLINTILINTLEREGLVPKTHTGDLAVPWRSVSINKDSFFEAWSETLCVDGHSYCAVHARFVKGPQVEDYFMWPNEFERVFGEAPGNPRKEA